MDRWILRLRLHRYSEHSEEVTCTTVKVSNFSSACRVEAKMMQDVQKERLLIKEAFLQATLYKNNEVVYKHSYQLI